MQIKNDDAFDFSAKKLAQVAQVAIFDSWIAHLPVSWHQYLIIRKWIAPKGFVVAVFDIKLMAYMHEEHSEHFLDASEEFCERLAPMEAQDTAV